ncbi:hypothetical protein BWQ96_02192 [Gracilariopsis chorda]|uniref:Uncharacterized protein n=1 Tax=Gracilariopsis chorda TaxID=448386 RepID=A0A2V3J0S4_9FLOR|nr:hypothetical protein BWQ96_02192 [Gracilariopsis chorda]|eukprot:PXF48001.1 hypothetical protein BWQ96_02192 [Gracilariopsis chorda]
MADEQTVPLRPVPRSPLLSPSERIPLAPAHTDHNASTPSAYESPSPPTSPSTEYPYGAVARVVPDSYVTQNRRLNGLADPQQTVHLITDSSASEYSADRYVDHTRLEISRLRQRLMDTYILGAVIVAITTIVSVIMASGLATMVANRNSAKLEIFSDWPDGGVIPLKYGCHAHGHHPISIPLRWENVPASATNLIVLFSHPGALHDSTVDPVHWFVTNIRLDEAAPSFMAPNASVNAALMPGGAVQRANAFSHQGYYWPPCSNTTSVFTVHAYAVEAPAVIEDTYDAREIIMRLDGVPGAKLHGTYSRHSPSNMDLSSSLQGHSHDDHHSNAGASQNDTEQAGNPKPHHPEPQHNESHNSEPEHSTPKHHQLVSSAAKPVEAPMKSAENPKSNN